jgi:hypothetical protein
VWTVLLDRRPAGFTIKRSRSPWRDDDRWDIYGPTRKPSSPYDTDLTHDATCWGDTIASARHYVAEYLAKAATANREGDAGKTAKLLGQPLQLDPQPEVLLLYRAPLLDLSSQPV